MIIAHQLSLIDEPWDIRHERVMYGPYKKGDMRFEWWWKIYYKGAFHIKFLKQETAVNYVRAKREADIKAKSGTVPGRGTETGIGIPGAETRIGTA